MMRLYRKNSKVPYLGVMLSAAIFALIVGVFLIYLNSLSEHSGSESKKITEQAIHRALISCYAIEGVYPSSVEYLEENYGVLIDHSRYEINFQTAGANVIPAVELIEVDKQQ